MAILYTNWLLKHLISNTADQLFFELLENLKLVNFHVGYMAYL
jgi:hypothetical protein